MKPDADQRIRLQAIRINNFKIIDSLQLDFPAPRMKDDPDVFVMGSQNGLGKTAVLECCAFLFGAGAVEDDRRIVNKLPDVPVDLVDLLVRSGAANTVIEGAFELGETRSLVRTWFDRGGTWERRIDGPFSTWLSLKRLRLEELTDSFFPPLMGMDSNPLLMPPLVYFHSYRKVAEEKPALGMMVESRPPRRVGKSRSVPELPVSQFKLELLRSMMSKADLFEGLTNSEGEASLSMMNELMSRYARGKVIKLRPSDDNRVDFMVRPDDGSGSFTFDGLSSGQKEIISTLFLIWRHTADRPGIVLIDEPELHLNSEWQVDFIDQLYKIAPQNQYIIATHSEDIFASVPEDRRVILRPSSEGGT